MICHELAGASAPARATGSYSAPASTPSGGPRVIKRIYNTAFKMPVRSGKAPKRK